MGIGTTVAAIFGWVLLVSGALCLIAFGVLWFFGRMMENR